MTNFRQMDLDQDYQMLSSWWERWDHPVIAKEDLIKTGYLVEINEIPIIGAFLCITNGVYAFVTSFVSNPDSTWQQREDGVKYLLEGISEIAEDLKFKRLIIIPEKPYLKDKIEKSGFYVNNEKVFLCVKELKTCL